MSVNDPIVTDFYHKAQQWRLLQGRETFYDDDRCLRLWDTEKEAVDWAKENYPNSTILREDETIPIHRTVVVSTSLTGLPLWRKQDAD